MSDDEDEDEDQNADDLAQLRSMNEGELSADWYNFQEIIAHLQVRIKFCTNTTRSMVLKIHLCFS